ncbi:MAG: ribonuclease HIII [Acholeplasmatales bacterium]|nr:ribonuclease HIII [Acholeplasmatales bacterium]
MYVILIDKLYINRLKNLFVDFLVTTNNPYIAFKASYSTITIECYTSGKVVFKGDDNDLIKKMLEKIDFNFEITTSPDKQEVECTSSIGSDEVGTGDLFGPVVICSFFLDSKDSDYLISLGITDSKKLTDEKIMKIGPLLKDYTYNVILIKNEKYNELIDSGYNLNEIKAIAHNKAIICTINDIEKKVPVILDEFCSPDNYFRYLKGCKMVYDEITFKTKAESKYLAVACASVMARYIFLTEMDKMSKLLGFEVPKGAGIKADEALKKIKDKDLKRFIKLNFKNVSNID